MKKVYVLFFLIFGSLGVFSQTTVFTDPFTTSTGATYTVAPGAIGTSTTWSMSRSGVDMGAKIDAGILDLTNDGSATANANGWVFGNTPTTAFTAPYNATLNLNPSTVTWTFNMRQIRTDPSGLASGNYGVAFILAGSSTAANNTGSGYAVVLGQSGATDAIRLIRYTNGLATLANLTNILVSNTSGLTDFGADYLSIKVTYAPATNTWELFLRNDGTTAFADPAVGTLTTQGTAVDATYTGTSLGFLGGYWNAATGATQTAFFDNMTVTVAPAGVPNIIVTPATLTGFLSTSGVPSAEQSYTVSGTDLTANIVITPPAGFEISPTTGPFTATNPITLTPTGGTVGTTTIYVRMNSVTAGPNSGNITHVSAGSNNPNVAVSGNVLAAEPTIQSTITIGAVTNSTVLVNFGGGNGTRRILLARLATPVNSDPVDGTTYTANANFGNGSQIGTGNFVVYDGIGNAQLVTGLTAGATYHFAIYDYNDGGVAGAENYLVPGGVGDATLATYSVPYVWIGLDGDWQVPTNWAPDRLFPATNDSLLFTSAAITETVSNVPTQTVGYIGVSLLTNTTFQASAPGNVLTIGDLTGTDLFVDAGSSLNLNTASALTLNLVTGATASISGSMSFTGAAHRLTSPNAAGITFNNGSVFTAGTGFIGNAFGAATANSVVFTSGSRYEQSAGSNPFALGQPASVVVFNSGSLFKLLGNLTPSVSGRTYANFELDFPAAVLSATGVALLTMDTLTVTNGSITFGMTTAGFNLRGNIAVAAGGTLIFNPASISTLNLNGTSNQSITNAGVLTFAANQTVNINNAAGITLNSPVTISGNLNFTTGLVNTTATNLLTMAAGSSVTGASNASFVNGRVSKIGNTGFIFPIGKPNTGPSATVPGYAALEISAPADIADRFTAEYMRGNANAMGPITAPGLDHVSACDYWTLTRDAGASTVDITLYWKDSINNCSTVSPYVNNLPSLTVAHFDGASWDAYGVAGLTTGTPASGTVTWGIPQSSTFGIFAIASTDGNNPLPITINYFKGAKQNGKHLLDWKVTCISTPSATIELQRSSDGGTFSSIYNINVTALRCEQPFDHIDNNPAKGVNYYRLKMTDADGKITYSTIVSLINASKGMEIMNIAPNPIVNGAFTLKVSTAEKMQMEVMITDMQGRLMQRQVVNMIAGFNTIPMNVQNLANGTYQLQGNTADGRTRVLRFVIQ